mmetsp:Transcript_26125/g.38825  ORF Transcript_26125/g.38825 Transcript_26125/m.38825 type:complete len:95 (+) Transcript_26125:12-296(+)
MASSRLLPRPTCEGAHSQICIGKGEAWTLRAQLRAVRFRGRRQLDGESSPGGGGTALQGAAVVENSPAETTSDVSCSNLVHVQTGPVGTVSRRL